MASGNSNMPVGATAHMRTPSRERNHGGIPKTAALQIDISIATDDLNPGDAGTERGSSTITRDSEDIASPMDAQAQPLLDNNNNNNDPLGDQEKQMESKRLTPALASAPSQRHDPNDDCSPGEAKARIVYSFQGQASNELGVEVGEMVVVVEKASHGESPPVGCVVCTRTQRSLCSDRAVDVDSVRATTGWWLVRNKQGVLGWVPASFVQELQGGRRSRTRWRNEGLKGLAW